MPFLVCDKCGGYYELKQDEFQEDFSDKCECGGKFKYVISMGGPSVGGVKSERESLVARFLRIPTTSVLHPKHNLLFDIGMVLSVMGATGFLILIIDPSQTYRVFFPSFLLLSAGAPFLGVSYGYYRLLCAFN